MADWNPDLYRLYEDERTRPALDLLDRVAVRDPATVVDLGCGPGNSTELLAHRFPKARISGVDTSPAMLLSARDRLPGLDFIEADIAGWSAGVPVHVLYANAVLQWLPGHAALVPRLFAMLAPGGVLAFQVPDNLDEPSHRLMRAVAAQPRWQDKLQGAQAARAKSVLRAEAYYDLLAPLSADTEVWRTVYHHPIPSPAGIVDWLRATGLRPYLDRLQQAERASFLAEYEAAIGEAYPARTDGRRLLAFPRLFVVARAKA